MRLTVADVRGIAAATETIAAYRQAMVHVKDNRCRVLLAETVNSVSYIDVALSADMIRHQMGQDIQTAYGFLKAHGIDLSE